MPAYNHELYIEEALQSVINQTYKNIEFIILNDGSTDSTAEIIEKFINNNQGKNVQFVNKQNEGVCKTMNMGLAMATGDYVAFLASDDKWIENKLEVQLAFMENNKNIGLVCSDAYFTKLNLDTNLKWSNYKVGMDRYFKKGIQKCNMHEVLLSRPLLCAVTVMLRREIFNEVDYFDEQLPGEDTDMWLRVARKYPIGYIDQPLAYYRMHGANISNNILFLIRGLFMILRKHFREEPLRSNPIKKCKILMILLFNLIVTKAKRVLINICS
jgi:glycosyltransferase involved in cell wall biosynthesis